jgi:uncharacterized membrane protein
VAYKERVAADLDRWIASGWVAGERRGEILASIPDSRRLDAATALGGVGAVLAGIALVAFVAANWDALPRLARFAVVLGVFGAGAGAGAWALAKGRPGLANGALTFAAIAFAAAIGLTGQIFDIAGDQRWAAYAAGIVAAGLALAGRASGPAVVALAFFGLADDIFSSRPAWDIPWLAIASPLAAVAAARWRSTVLAHAAALGVIFSAMWLVGRFADHRAAMFALAAAFAILAAAGRWLGARAGGAGRRLYGWFVWAALGFLIAAGIDFKTANIVHRLAVLALSAGLIGLGRFDRHSAVTAAGTLGLLIAIPWLLADLGVDLIAIAGVFLLLALAAIAAAVLLRRRKA